LRFLHRGCRRTPLSSRQPACLLRRPHHGSRRKRFRTIPWRARCEGSKTIAGIRCLSRGINMSDQHLESINIRPAERADAAVLGSYGAALMSLHHTWDPARFIPAGPTTPDKYASWLASQVVRDDVVVLVAEDRESIIGYVYAGLEGPDYMSLRGPAGVFHDIFVDPQRRREGVGRRLLERAITMLSGRGAPRIVLSTAYANMGAQALFDRMGFRATMVEMTKNLE